MFYFLLHFHTEIETFGRKHFHQKSQIKKAINKAKAWKITYVDDIFIVG